MIVRDLEGLPAERVVSAETWISHRLLLRGDGMGFSMHDTRIKAGTRTEMTYKNHLEAVYCVCGTGYVEELETGRRHPLRDGTVYALDQHDPHVLVAETELRMVCVFRPALVGPETHGPDGSYPTLGDDDG